MQRYESFGECLKRCLKEAGLSASEAARLVGFRSRNSIFRILSGDAGCDIKLRFLQALREALGDSWPEARWLALQEALSVERLGPERYEENRAFQQMLHGKEDARLEFSVVQALPEGSRESDLGQLLTQAAQNARTEVIITGCCDSDLSLLLADRCGEAGAKGTLTVRHYIDTAKESVCKNILGILPLVSKPWYNARLVEETSCPPEMMAIYRLHCIHIQCWDEAGRPFWTLCVRYDRQHFTLQDWQEGLCPAVTVIDRWRFHLELLKPMPDFSDGAEKFVEYTRRYAELEDSCAIWSIKPDVHFNCIPTAVLEQAVLEGFEQSGLAVGEELGELMEGLRRVHNQRYDNMLHKRRPTHLIYSQPAMERFVRTGVLSDHFFIQRAYTVEERRQIIRGLLEAMCSQPYFNVHFFREPMPDTRYEISCYDGKGVLMMDAYTGYELVTDHSEALITLPAFMKAFKGYFMEELLAHYVVPRQEAISILERLLVMNVQE